MAAANLRAGVIQVQSDDDVAANLARCEEQLQAAIAEGAQLIVLPENFAYFGSEVGKRAVAELVSECPTAEDGPILRWLRAFAQEHQVTLLAGGMPERSNDAQRPYNTALVVAPTGDVVERYRKVHLFDVTLPNGQCYRESDATLAGQAAVVTDVAGYRVGLTICYDLRFPSLFQALAEQGAELLTVPAAFTAQTGQAHWHPLLRARAIEWQCWVLAAAQCGQHPGGRFTYGHSMIVDPWGAIVAECGAEPGVCVAELDRAVLENVRARIPCASHRQTFRAP
jgi:deaminated glutathione amidase